MNLAMEEAIRIEDRWYVLATHSRHGDPTRVLKHGETFGLFDGYGDIPRVGVGEHGIYHQGTRFLSHYELRINGQKPTLLNSSVKQDNSQLHCDLTTPDLHEGPGENAKLEVLKGTVHLARSRLLWDAACHERLEIANYGAQPVALRLTLEFAADYADIFEVRGYRRERRGQELPPELSPARVRLGYRGLDGVVRRTDLDCSPPPETIAPDHVAYELVLAPRATAGIEITVTCDPDARERAPMDFAKALLCTEATLRSVRARSASVETTNQQFNHWLFRSSADLTMLTAGNPEGPYPYAGVPWYSTPFGRDGILTAMEYLWADPSVARGVLAFLARTQADRVIPERDAEPGKIVHEMRKGELANLGEIPFGCYYGTIDSTPLFVALAGAYYQRTGDLEFVRRLWPHVERALDWMREYGDVDGDGFLEYQRKSAEGLANQGWKDSEDAVFHRDGALADGPIALAEVQGYAYLAKMRAARLAQALGAAERADTLRREAGDLRERFERAFWSEELESYVIALDGRKRPCVVRSSNAGQVLWSGIASPEHAQRTARTLFSRESFSGWGVRTLAEGEARYNPMSYHNGSIWPHDNALIALGLARYGMKDKTIAILTALFEASLFMDLHRLPELWCGFVRRPSEGPTLYPVACSPQAWASASVFYVLQACLGLSFHPEAPRIRFTHPILPAWMQRVQIANLRVGDAVVDLDFERHEHDVGVSVVGKSGSIDVSVVL
ncbi:MAG TPA: amylo-alpha-1,6-glucosidase [Burkholderiales bacterium]